MTCIVAIKHNKKIYMGGDSLGTDSHMNKVVRTDEKVFIKDDMIFGFCGSFRMGQILRYVMQAPERPEGIDDMHYLVGYWIPVLIETFSEHGFRGPKSEDTHDETKTGGDFLLGYRGTLYQIEEDFQVGIPAPQYAAIGCGGEYALGAIHTAKLLGEDDPKKLILTALDVAENFSAGVQRPFKVLSI